MRERLRLSQPISICDKRHMQVNLRQPRHHIWTSLPPLDRRLLTAVVISAILPTQRCTTVAQRNWRVP